MLKSKRLITFVLLLVILVTSFIVVLGSRYSVPILMYHSVNPGVQKGNRLAVTADTFERQMRFLREHNYNVVSLEKAASLIQINGRLPHKLAVVTFDDGYKDNYVYAFPVLKKYNIPATISLIVDEISRPQGDRVSWDDINIMLSSGLISFASHTLTHPWLPELTSELQLKKEIFGSKKILEDKLGTKINIFCYPGGRFNAKIRQMVIDAGYKVAIATKMGSASGNRDLFALRRIRISEGDGNIFIFWFKVSGYYNAFRSKKNGY